VLGCGSAGRAELVNTNSRLTLAPRVIAGYNQCRSSVPVTSVIPVCTVAPWAECPMIA
jgi:hypothetical protein